MLPKIDTRKTSHLILGIILLNILHLLFGWILAIPILLGILLILNT